MELGYIAMQCWLCVALAQSIIWLGQIAMVTTPQGQWQIH